LAGGNLRSIVRIDRLLSNDTWENIKDVDGESGIDWTDSVRRRQYANYGRQPIANTIGFTVENRDGRYSPGSGELEDDVLQIDTRVRIRHTYQTEAALKITDETDVDSGTLLTELGFEITDENGVGIATDNLISTEDGLELVLHDEHLMYQSVYYLDDPSYNVNNLDTDTVDCQGRDAYKKAIETDVFIDDISGGASIDQLIKDLCDQVGIKYTGTSIVDLSSFGVRTLAVGLDAATKADEIFNDNALYVQPTPTLYEADFAFTEAEIMGIGAFKKDRTQFLQRITCSNITGTPTQRELLGSDTLEDETKAISLSKQSLYRSYFIAKGISATVTLDAVANTSLTFTVTGKASIEIYGTGGSPYPTIIGESIDNDNMLAQVGQTAHVTSALFQTDAECTLIAKGIDETFGQPDKEITGLEYPYCNTFLITNDMVFPFIRNIFEDDLYFIVGISHSWSFFNESTNFELKDSGLNWEDVYGSFIYDSVLYNTHIDLDYDIGLAYDMGFGPNAKESDIIAQSEADFIYDVAEA